MGSTAGPQARVQILKLSTLMDTFLLKPKSSYELEIQCLRIGIPSTRKEGKIGELTEQAWMRFEAPSSWAPATPLPAQVDSLGLRVTWTGEAPLSASPPPQPRACSPCLTHAHTADVPDKGFVFRKLKTVRSEEGYLTGAGPGTGAQERPAPKPLLPGNGVRWGRLEPAGRVGLVHGLVPPGCRGRAYGDHDRPHAQLLSEPRSKPAAVSSVVTNVQGRPRGETSPGPTAALQTITFCTSKWSFSQSGFYNLNFTAPRGLPPQT